MSYNKVTLSCIIVTSITVFFYGCNEKEGDQSRRIEPVDISNVERDLPKFSDYYSLDPISVNLALDIGQN